MNKPTKGWLSGLRDLVIEETPDKNASDQPQGTPTSAAPVHVVVAPQPVHVVPAATVDPIMRKKLEEAIAAESPPGYSEITGHLVTLGEDITDEKTLYRSAIKIASKNGHDLAALLGDMDKCIGVLEAKEREFNEEAQRQINTKVGARRGAITKREQEIEAKTAMIAQLQQEIAQLRQDNLAETEVISSETAKITATSNNFNVTYQVVHAALIDQRNKIATYGKV